MAEILMSHVHGPMRAAVARGIRRLPFAVTAILLVLSAPCLGVDKKDPRLLLDRLAYGPSPEDTRRIRSLGASAFIEEQLHPESIDDSAFEARLA